MANAFQAEGLTVFGPTKEQARLESNRDWAKKIAGKNRVPMGPYSIFTNLESATEYAKPRTWPLYVKDNGSGGG
ncbi:phosphoribosylamine--glycine ligase, partial [Staphylococcus aureus]